MNEIDEMATYYLSPTSDTCNEGEKLDRVRKAQTAEETTCSPTNVKATTTTTNKRLR